MAKPVTTPNLFNLEQPAPASSAPSDLFRCAAAHLGTEEVARRIGVHQNTVHRWTRTGQVPCSYLPDLQRMLGMSGTPDTDTQLDQYFTRPETARRCFHTFLRVMETLHLNTEEHIFVEPSMGEGCFYDLFPADRRIGIDIAPCRPETLRADYLLWQPEQAGRYLVVGNPPFGLRGHKALQFIRHSHTFADAVGFILPQMFVSDGKGAPAKRVTGYRLAHSEDLAGDSFTDPTGRGIPINTVFQVWAKAGCEHLPAPGGHTCAEYITVYSLSDGGSPASTRNRHMIGECDIYLPSTTFAGMHAYDRYEDLPHRRGYGVVIHQNKQQIRALLAEHDWKSTAFLSTNSALNLRRSMIESVITEAGYRDRLPGGAVRRRLRPGHRQQPAQAQLLLSD